MNSSPDGMQVFERGWLSANNILLTGEGGPSALVDSGYCSHSLQTLALVESALGEIPLDLLLNTHLHSDHCGGNAALQARYPDVRTLVPPGEAPAVQCWDEARLSYAATGQDCPRFRFDALLLPGSTHRWGANDWQVHAAPGHDASAVLLYAPAARTLLSADALWANGFGVVFPELDGAHAFEDVAATLDLIERLAPTTVVPGHGPVFTDLKGAIGSARRRLDSFVRDPVRHASHAAKVLLKFKLLQWQQQDAAELHAWVAATRLMRDMHRTHFGDRSMAEWSESLVDDLARVGAAQRQGSWVLNT